MPSSTSPAHTTSSSPTTSTLTLQRHPTVLSPTVSSRFSQAETLLTQESNYTANTGGRARQSWRGRNLAKLNSFLSNDPKNRVSTRRRLRSSATANSPSDSIPVDQPESLIAQPSMSELPAAPVAHTRPDEPRSFFDSDSSSESGDDGQRDTIISRASSVRVQRPQIVQYHSWNHHRSQSPTILDAATIQSTAYLTGSLSKAQQVLDTEMKRLTQEAEPAESNPDLLVPSTTHSTAALTDADSGPKPKLLALANPDPDPASTSASAEASNTAIPLTSHSNSNPSTSIRHTVLESPDTSMRAEALNTVPTPLGGFGSPCLNTLRSSALSATETRDWLVHRAISAPPLLNNSSNTSAAAIAARANRKAKIRPSDLVITDARGNHHLLRESVVSTPYPSQNESVRRQEEAELVPAIAIPVREAQSATEALHSDRFPSPFCKEILFLRLSLAGHEKMNVRIEVEIRDCTTFDDEALFGIIRNQLKASLLRWPRGCFSAWKLNYATSTTGTGEFDGEDFLAHLNSLKTGHKRKSWLMWLRSHQIQVGEKNTNASSASMLPRIPFGATTPSTTTSASAQNPGFVPHVVLHHAFVALRVVLAILAVLLASVAATVLWVLLGPSSSSNSSTDLIGLGIGALSMGGRQWRLDAQARVLTALVLGVLVFLLGGLGLAAWVGGSWVSL